MHSAVVVVEWLAKLALDRVVLGSIPTPFNFYSVEPAVIKLIRCQQTQKEWTKTL